MLLLSFRYVSPRRNCLRLSIRTLLSLVLCTTAMSDIEIVDEDTATCAKRQPVCSTKRKLRQSTLVEIFGGTASKTSREAPTASTNKRHHYYPAVVQEVPLTSLPTEDTVNTEVMSSECITKESPVIDSAIGGVSDIELDSKIVEDCVEKGPNDRLSAKGVSNSDTARSSSSVTTVKMSAITEPKKDGKAHLPSVHKVLSVGPPIKEFNVAPMCSPPLGKLLPSERHSVFVNVKTIEGSIPPSPYPSSRSDSSYGWHSGANVKLPCSDKCIYPVDDPSANQQQLVNKWKLVQESLSKADTWTSSLDIEEAILSYNDRYKRKWSFAGLHRLFTEEMSAAESGSLFKETLPRMAQLALRLPQLITKPIPMLQKQMNHRLTFSQEQVACLLANAFFCTFPGRNAHRIKYPPINFNPIFRDDVDGVLEKLKCIFHYFRRVVNKMPLGTVTFERCALSNGELKSWAQWLEAEQTLGKLHISADGTIEDFGVGMLQMDFANKYLGGGVLGHGLVQEEIRFLISPELIISRLFTEELDANEALFMTGAERFSYYTGYGSTFEWTGTYVDLTPRDSWGRLETEIVALDALPFSSYASQFTTKALHRELTKALVGFGHFTQETKFPKAIATGNWGCGAFGGDKQLKSLIQLATAAVVGRDIVYFTFGDEVFMRELYDMHLLIVDNNVSAGGLLKIIEEFHSDLYVRLRINKKEGGNTITLFEFLRNRILGTESDRQGSPVTP